MWGLGVIKAWVMRDSGHGTVNVRDRLDWAEIGEHAARLTEYEDRLRRRLAARRELRERRAADG